MREQVGDVDAEMITDVAGLVVASGFIEMHNHYDINIIVNPKAESFIRQGATTLVYPNCGVGVYTRACWDSRQPDSLRGPTR